MNEFSLEDITKKEKTTITYIEQEYSIVQGEVKRISSKIEHQGNQYFLVDVRLIKIIKNEYARDREERIVIPFLINPKILEGNIIRGRIKRKTDSSIYVLEVIDKRRLDKCNKKSLHQNCFYQYITNLG